MLQRCNGRLPAWRSGRACLPAPPDWLNARLLAPGVDRGLAGRRFRNRGLAIGHRGMDNRRGDPTVHLLVLHGSFVRLLYTDALNPRYRRFYLLVRIPPIHGAAAQDRLGWIPSQRTSA